MTLTTSDWQHEQGQKCGCKGSDENCPCQNVSPAQISSLRSREVPPEIMCWHSVQSLDHIGTWATTRYPDEAAPYVPKSELERVRAAAELGLKMAEANGLWNTAETIREALEPAKQARA